MTLAEIGLCGDIKTKHFREWQILVFDESVDRETLGETGVLE